MDKKNLILFIFTALFCFFILELSVRLLGNYDLDNEFSFRGYRFKPYQLPANALQKIQDDYLSLEKPFYVYDYYLGYDLNINAKHPNGLYETNSIGIRSSKEFDVKKKEEVKRIMFFGDSYVFASDVPYNESWNYHLDNMLGDKFEVMNFGIGGFGIDQAYLKWKLQGQKYKPDIVVIGFQAENCRRNLYIIRKIYDRKSELPFIKPRFILENNELKLVNYPVTNFKELPTIVRNFHNHELNKYEYFYHKEDYEDKIWYKSKLLYLISFFIKDYLGYEKVHRNYYREDSEEIVLCHEILKKFVNEVEKNSKVILLHIPKQEDIAIKLDGKTYFYEDFLNKLKKEFVVIDIADDLLKVAKEKSIDNVYKGHYTSEGNKILAQNVYEKVKDE